MFTFILRISAVCLHVPGVPTSFGQDFSKKSLNVSKSEKKLWKFVYILAKQCRSHLNLTNFFDQKNFKILISPRFEIFTKTFHLKLVGTHCTYDCFWNVYFNFYLLYFRWLQNKKEEMAIKKVEKKERKKAKKKR